MKTIFDACIIATLAGVLALSAYGQTTGSASGSTLGSLGGGTTGPATGLTVVTNLGQALSNATQLAKNNNPVGAELALTATNAFQANTAAWHLETTQKLIQLSNTLARQGTTQSISALANSALQHLSQAALQAIDTRSQGIAKATAGYIYERYIGDHVSAISAYQAAIKLNPDDQASQEALARLQASDAFLRAKIHPAKK